MITYSVPASYWMGVPSMDRYYPLMLPGLFGLLPTAAFALGAKMCLKKDLCEQEKPQEPRKRGRGGPADHGGSHPNPR